MIEPLPGYGESAGQARRGVRRSAILFTPMFLLALAALVASVTAVATGDGGNLIIVLIIAALLTLLLGFQAVGALLDLGADLRETQGPIRRKWKRSDFFFWKSYYLRVEGGIFRIDPVAFELLQENDHVLVRHLPRTGSVEALARIHEARADGEDAADTVSASRSIAGEETTEERRRSDLVLGEFFRARPGEPEPPETREDDAR